MELERGSRECHSMLLSTVSNHHAFNVKLIVQDLATLLHFVLEICMKDNEKNPSLYVER